MNFKKGAMYVLVANIISLLISLFTGFVLPKLLSVETYASIKLFQLYVTYIGILHLGFADGMYLRYGGKQLQDVDKKEVLSNFKTFKIFQLIVSLGFVAISIFIKNELLFFCSLVVLPINVGNYLRNLYQAIGEYKRYSKFTNINSILIFLINVIILFIIKSDVANMYIVGYIIVYFIYWIVIEIENRKIFGTIRVNADSKYLIEDIKSGFFLMIGNFCNVIFTSIDRIFVQNLLGSIKFAFYSFAVGIENLMTVFITPISTVMYNYLCNNREKEQVIRLKEHILVFATLIISAVFPAKFIIDNWLTKYLDATNVLFILFAAQYASIIVKCIHINIYKAEKKQRKYFIIMVIMVVLSVILNVIFYYINKSMEMIALATLITNIIWLVIGEVDLKKYRFKTNKYLYMILILGLFLACSRLPNAIVGFAVYIGVSIVLILVFLPKSFKYWINEGKRVLLKKKIGEQ